MRTFVFLLLLLCSCASSLQQAIDRDLDCSDVVIYQFSNTYRAVGCGKTASYVGICRESGYDTNCYSTGGFTQCKTRPAVYCEWKRLD